MRKSNKPIGSFDTSCYVATSKPTASMDSAVTSYQTSPAIGIHTDSLPPSFIDARDGVQGGKYCLRGTRVPVSVIKEAVKEGCSYGEITKSLRENFGIGVSANDIKDTVREYDNQVIPKA